MNGHSPAVGCLLAAALACPDRFLVHAAGPATRSFLLALVAEARGRGERLLVLTATAAAANQVVAELLTQDGSVVRAMEEAEAAETLPDAVRAAASRVVGVGRVEEARRRLADTIRDVGLQLDRWAAAAGEWPALRDLARKLAEPAQPVTDPARATEVAQAEACLPALRKELSDLAPLLEAKKSGKLFSKAFWKVTFNGDLTKRAEDLEAQIRQAERTLAAVNEQTPVPGKPSPDPALLDEFRRRCESLAAVGLTPPTAPTPEAIAAAQEAADGGRQEAEASANFARKTLADLESDPTAAAVQYLNRAAIVVGPRAALADLAVTAGTFDRVLLESAESVTRPEWAAITSASERMILMGDFPSQTEPRRHAGHLPAADLWRQTHRPLWSRDEGRLVAHLAAIEDAACEPLADRPEVELRFGTTPDGTFALGAVAFPAGTPVAEAKCLIAAELGEVQLMPLGPSRWHADQLLVCWPMLESHGESAWVDVEAGVREQVVPLDGLPVTAAVSFDPAVWTRDAAEAWVADKSRAARSRRTATLPEPALA